MKRRTVQRRCNSCGRAFTLSTGSQLYAIPHRYDTMRCERCIKSQFAWADIRAWAMLDRAATAKAKP